VRPASPQIAFVYWTSVSDDRTFTPAPRITSIVPASTRDTPGTAAFGEYSTATDFTPLSSAFTCLSRSR
jgi:hypothetical protein